MPQITIDKSKLEDWFNQLDSPKDAKRACFNVAEAMYDVLQQSKTVEKETSQSVSKDKGLTFNQLQLGQKYKFRSDKAIRSILRGAEVEIVKKNRTKVHAKLTHSIQGYPAGTIVNTHPQALIEK